MSFSKESNNKETHHDVSFLSSLSKKLPTTIRFFDRNEYYSLYGEDALYVSKEIFKTHSLIKYIENDSEKIPYLWLSKSKFEIQLRDLLFIKQYRVEIYKNLSSGKGNDWQIVCKASPGNLTQVEDMLFSNDDISEDLQAKGVLAIKLSTNNQQKIVGIAYCDTFSQKILVAEFPDNDTFSNLQACIIHLSPKECLLAHDRSSHYKVIEQVMEKNNVLITEMKISDFNSKDIVQDLNRLLKFNNSEQGNAAMLSEIDLKYSMCGIAAIIKYLELLSDENNFGHFKLDKFELSQFVHLDSAAVKALGLIPLISDENKSCSLFGLLNRCRTIPGQRLLSQWIKQPLLDINKIEERLNIVEILIENTELRQTLYEEHLRKIPDLQRLSKKFMKKKASLQDCYKVYQTLGNLTSLINVLEKYNDEKYTNLKEALISPLQELNEDFTKFCEMVESTIDLERVDNGEFMVRPEFDQDLQELRNQMITIEEEIKDQFYKVAKDLGLEPDKSLKLENCSQIGYYFRVTRKEEKVLRKKNYITIDAKNNGVRFHNAILKKLNDTYISLNTEYKTHQKSVIELIIGIAAGYCEPMQQLSDLLAQLDVFIAFSMSAIGAPQPFTRPKLLPNEYGIINLKQARHPCLEVQENIDFIPNDVILEKKNKNFHIITGPNMGGKSTFIRSVAINVLMAQIGSFIPCEEGTISIVDAILTRVGAGDMQLKGVSTFMAEMLETASILKSSTENSLIIIDELGRGTSTYDGFGLAWAISEYVAKKINAYCLFATHFHELTTLAEKLENVNNLHVTALTSEENITFLYKIKEGICDQSFGIHVAELAHFPSHIIKHAKQKLNDFEDFHWYGITSNEAEPLAKKRKLEYEEAEQIMKEFISDICNSLDTIKEDEFNVKLKDLKSKIIANNNPYINKLISKI